MHISGYYRIIENNDRFICANMERTSKPILSDENIKYTSE